MEVGIMLTQLNQLYIQHLFTTGSYGSHQYLGGFMYKIRQLGFGIDCGVISIWGECNEPRNIAIFPTSGIITHIMISESIAVIISNTGEFVRFNCDTGASELRTKPIRLSNRLVDIHFYKPKNEIYFIHNGGTVSVLDATKLTLVKSFNAGLRTKENEYTLFNFQDVAHKFKALSDLECEKNIKIKQAAETANENPVFPPKKWSTMHMLSNWPKNHGEYCRFDFSHMRSALRDNGDLVLPYHYTKEETDKTHTVTSGIATLSLTTKGRRLLIT